MKKFILVFLLLIPLRLFPQGGVITVADDYNDQSREYSLYNENQIAENEKYEYLLLTPLKAYQNPFNSLSEYNFSFVRYRKRGYDFRQNRTTVSGIDLTDEITGNTLWNISSAANNIRQGRRTSYELSPSSENMGLAGSITNYNINAYNLNPEYRTGFMFADSRFRAGVRFSAATGELENGWAFSLAGTRKWGRDTYVKGVYTDSWSLNSSISKKINKNNHISIAYLTAPTEQGVRGAATKEALQLTSDNLYNPYWGYQNGEIRNSRVRKSTPSLFMATWDFDSGEKFRLSSSLAYITDKSSYSSIDWYDAANPMSDYYRYMPSFFANPETAADVESEWRNGNIDVTQIDWRELYYANSRGSETAAYILSSRVSDMQKLQFASVFNYSLSQKMRLDGGVRLKHDVTSIYSRLDDLLGADHILDIDQYLVDDEYYGDKLENNMDGKGRKIRKGDTFAYNYDLNHKSYEGWAILDIGSGERVKNLSGYIGAQAGMTSFQRDGYFEKELFSGGLSKGKSGLNNFTTYILKAGVSYNISPSHHAGINIAYGDITPQASNIFVSPDYQNTVIKDPKTINILGGEFNYMFGNSSIEVWLSGYATRTSGETDIRHYYDDISSLYSNLIITGIEKLYAGVEVGLDIALTSRLSLKTAAALTNNRYANNPAAKLIGDKNSRVITENEVVYLKAYRLGGSPQRIASAELAYSGTKMWMASISVNYAGDNYIDVNPIRRTKRVCDRASSPEAISDLTSQERFAEATTINVFLSKTFRLGTHYLSISGSVNNLANKKNIIQSGYEQMRLSKSGTGLNQTILPFGSKYYYAYGRTFYLTLNFKF